MLKKGDKKSKDALQSTNSVELHGLEQERIQNQSTLDIPEDNAWTKTQRRGGLAFIVLGVITIILAVIEIIVTVFGGVTERFYDAPHSGRLIAMTVLAVIAAATSGLIIYAIVGVRKKHTKPLHATAVVLLILMIIQALITGLAVKISDLDEMNISRSLSESFFRAREGETTQIEIWDSTQAGLECCGLYSPEDYRDPYAPLYFPPEVPVSCCPPQNYPNTTRSKELDICKTNGAYYGVGCKLPVLDVIKGASESVIVISVLLIVSELVVAILGAVLSKKRKDEQLEIKEFTPSSLELAGAPQNEATK